ncbi:phosphoribosylformylglycinamidine cyclo-ligase [bacterium]|nr:phosphoribosylformylglycinamidine cyclo-ligase [candidate division CSSED10-310 bacterium]
MSDSEKPLTYRDAGVDIDLADAFVEKLKSLAASTFIPGTLTELGSFAGAFSIQDYRFIQPVLIACTDGVGTKLKLAFETGRHDTVGIDLVAMSVNDLIVTGAIPLFFLDYIATGKLDPAIHLDVVRGIADGCRTAGCSLIGGETAEMPGFYSPGEYDLAGFAVGIVDKTRMLSPDPVQPGDDLIGFPSSGLHSNGYSLVRKVFKDRSRYPLDQVVPDLGRTLADVLLEPTRIYSREVRILRECPGIRSMAHITGSGIPGNLPRALKSGTGATLYHSAWTVHPVFGLIASEGGISEEEMYRTFNMGLGLIAVCDAGHTDGTLERLAAAGFTARPVGRVEDRPGVRFRSDLIPRSSGFPVGQKTNRRLAVIGSGRGSNMESICEAIDRGDLNAEVVCVISNNSRAFILKRGRRRNIPVYHVSSATHPDPGQRESEMLRIFSENGVNVICLAGYMKKIPRSIIRAYPGRILNIHPALLPAFGGPGMFGMKVHEAVIRSGARYSGASVHIVDEEYDRGKIIGQEIVPVFPDDTPETLAERVLKVEHELYWRTLAEMTVD